MSMPFGSKVLKIAVCIGVGALLLLLAVVGYSRSQSQARTWEQREREWMRGEGAFFATKGCVRCHSISSMGIESSKLGPDLSDAVIDVERRFGKTLEEFLDNPTGTMSTVLATRIPLTQAEKREAIDLLKRAYQRKQEMRSQAATP